MSVPLRVRRRAFLIALILFAAHNLVPGAHAQSEQALRTPSAPRSLPAALSGSVHLTGTFDTNIHHAPAAESSYGTLPTLRLAYAHPGTAPALTALYEGGGHLYTGTDRWDRFSHRALLTGTFPLAPRLESQTRVEGSHLAASEDRDLASQISLVQSISHQATTAWRVEGYGTLKYKKYREGAREGAFRPNAGFRMRYRPAPLYQTQTDVRAEWNDQPARQNDYVRWRVASTHSFTVGAHRFEVLGTYRLRRYTARRIVQDARSVPLRRTQWRFETTYGSPGLGPLLIEMGYVYQGERSNEAARAFDAHLVSLSLVYPF